MHVPFVLASIILLLSQSLYADDVVPWANPAEKTAWEKIAERFEGEPDIKRNRQGGIERIEVRNLKKDPKESGWARIAFHPQTGHVIEVSSDRAGFTNDEFHLFQPFTQLEKLTLWHNSNFHDKSDPIENYDASGLKHLVGLKKLERITLAGGGFDDAGMIEAARFSQLKYLGMWHVRVSDAGMSALRNHPGLEEIRLGPFWGKLMTDETIAHLATCPQLKKLSVGETWLTYEGGLQYLARRKTPLEVLDLGNSLILPADVEKIRADLTETDVAWIGLEGAGKVLNESGWHFGKARKWMPADLLESAMRTASAQPDKQ